MRMWHGACCLIPNGDIMAYKVELDSIACIGCVACTRCEAFEMRPDMKAHAVQNIVLEIDCISDVAEGCPVGAITFSRLASNDVINIRAVEEDFKHSSPANPLSAAAQ